MKLHKKALCVVSLGLLLSNTALLAAEKNAKEIVNKAYAYLGSMDQYAFDAVVVDGETIDGEALKYKHNVSVKIDRPGKFRVDVKSDIKDRTNYLNNGVYTMIDHEFEYYGQLKTPKTIDGTLDFIFEKYGIRAPLTTLMYSDMDKRVKFKSNKYFGVVTVAGVECDYVAFKGPVREVHIWITTGDTPLVKTYSIINTEEKNARINTTLTWDTDPKISENTFIFTAPKSATKISITSAN